MCARCVSRSTTAFASLGSGNTFVPLSEREVGRHDQATAFVSLGEDLEDELRGAVGQRQVAQFVTDEKLGPGVAADDQGELAVALRFLELVREGGERGEADAASLVAGADRQGGGQHRFAGAAVADEDHALTVIDPRSLRQGGDRGLRDLGVVLEAEVLEAFDLREAGVDQPALLATFGAFGHLGLQQRAEVRDRGLLLAERFGRERSEAAADGGELELDRVRLDQRFQRCGVQGCVGALIGRSPGRGSATRRARPR